MDNLDWAHLLTYETRPIVDWSLLVEAAKSGKLLANQDILLDKNIGNGVADWDILPIKRVWGIFSFDRKD